MSRILFQRSTCRGIGQVYQIEKIAYALLMASRKLAIIASSNFPREKVFGSKESTSKPVKWATELAAFSLELATRTTIKSQVLADFMAEWQAPLPSTSEDSRKEEATGSHWFIRLDGSKCLNRAVTGSS